MIDKLEIGEFYKLVLDQNLWPDIFYYAQVSGVTNKEAMDNVTEYDLKEEMFNKLDYGTLTYLQNTECDIYLINEISDLTTGEIKEDIILLPINMIDFNLSDKLAQIYKLNYNISGIERRFNSTLDLDNHLKESRIELNKLLQKIKNFTGDNLAITASSSTIYKPLEEILLAEKSRNDTILNYSESNTKKKLEDESFYRHALKMINDAKTINNDVIQREELIKKEREKIETFYSDTMQFYDATNSFSDIMRSVNEKMIEKGKELGIEVPTFDSLVLEAKQEADQSKQEADEVIQPENKDEVS